MRERTLVLIKPDAVVNYHIGDIISRYEKEKFDIVAMRMLEMDDCIASKHYAEHVGKPYYQRLVDFMASDRIVALVVEGENAIERVRELHGKTDPNLAQPGTIRSDFALSKTVNTVHASDSPANAEREVHVFLVKQKSIYLTMISTLAYIMVIDKRRKYVYLYKNRG